MMPDSLTDYGYPSYQIGRQLMDALETAKLALALEDPLLHQWVPHLKKEKGQGRHQFIMGIALAADGAHAAWEAGYRDPPIPQLHDALVGLCAYAALLLRDDIMRRVLDGSVPGCDAAMALAVLNRFDSNPVALDNASWFSARMEERQ